MRSFILALCLSAAACSGGGLESPVSPTSAATAPTMPAATAGHELPFRGTFTLTTRGSFNCPPTCPPTILTIEGIQNGTATNLGRFTAVSVDVVNIATTEATGTLDFTAANGDQLRTTTVSHEEAFTPPNISTVSGIATIVGGTGRFAGATGSFTYRYTGVIDFANGTSSGAGSYEGHINLR